MTTTKKKGDLLIIKSKSERGDCTIKIPSKYEDEFNSLVAEEVSFRYACSRINDKYMTQQDHDRGRVIATYKSKFDGSR